MYTDSTHLKANANKNSQVRNNVRRYLEDLERAVDADRADHEKKLFPPEDKSEPSVKEIKQSTTDPDSGFMTRDGKPKGFYYLDHRTCEGRFNFITDVYVTPADIYDSLVYLGSIISGNGSGSMFRKSGSMPATTPRTSVMVW